jgi:RNA polymerase sigma-70 factor (ECF subfamily)
VSGVVISVVDAAGEASLEVNAGEVTVDLETVFRAQYGRIARVIDRVIRDPARAEDLAVEVFLRWSRNPRAQGENAEAWLYRTAERIGLNELRGKARRSRYEGMLRMVRRSPTPEEIHAAKEEQDKVRLILAIMNPKQAELLLLRSEGLSYGELASVLGLRSASVGTLLSRAQQAFRKEYMKRYGKQ